MKKSFLSVFLLLLLFGKPAVVKAQESVEWPERMPSLSFLLTAPIGVNANISFEYLKNTGKFYHGFIAGASVMGMQGVTVGPHLAYTMMLGLKSKHHFEFTAGGIIPADPDVTFFNFVPLVFLGYRLQEPGSKGFFKAGISSGGLGLGFGMVLN